MKVGILMIGTGRYINFFDKLYNSLNEHFLINHDKKIYLFTDANRKFPENVNVISVTRQGFPGDTMFRYNYFLSINQKLRNETDVLYYMDIDSLAVNTIGDEILPSVGKPLVAVAHPGFYKINLGTPETRPISKAYINPNEPREYYIAGGMQGGKTSEYLDAIKNVNDMIYNDYNRGIIPVYHDESMWNRYYTSNKTQFKILNPAYVYPECKFRNINIGNYHSLKIYKITPRLLALDKNHIWYRAA